MLHYINLHATYKNYVHEVVTPYWEAVPPYTPAHAG
jgi:hypothetical protein